jgi:hypothetical protein
VRTLTRHDRQGLRHFGIGPAVLRMRKKYGLLPIVRVLMLLGGLVVVSQQSALASFIYTVF